MNRKLLLIPLAAGACLAGLALAQSAPEGIDLEAIRARSAEHAKDAEALATTVRTRAEAVHDEALQSQTGAQAAAKRFAETVPATANGAEVFDFDAMVRERAEAEKAPLTQGPRFIAFASLSMPPEALKALVRDMGRAGGVGHPELLTLCPLIGPIGSLGDSPEEFPHRDFGEPPLEDLCDRERALFFVSISTCRPLSFKDCCRSLRISARVRLAPVSSSVFDCRFNAK